MSAIAFPVGRTADEARPTWRITDVNLKLWQGVLLTFPLYLLPSGGPQLSNLVLVAILVRFFIQDRVVLDRRARFVLKTCFLFVAYTFFVNLFYSLKFSTWQFVLNGPFYLYNMLFLGVAFALYSQYRERFFEASLKAMMWSVAYQVPAGLYLMRGGAIRQTVFFNNPNQLGYYALLAGAIVIFCARVVKVADWKVGLTLLGVFFLALISLSKAAMAGAVLMLLVFGLRRPKAGALFALLVVGIGIGTPVGQIVFGKALARAASVGGQSDDSAEGRGYDRITNYPQYWMVGAGEGGYQRFNKYGGKEIHSVFGTLLFCYGIVGSALAYLFIYQACRGLSWDGWPLLPLAFYGTTHQGLRFSLLWGVLAIAWAVGDTLRRRRLEAAASG